MVAWQLNTVQRLREALPGALVEPYGSATEPATLDGWSDLDVHLRAETSVDVAAVLDANIWAFQQVSKPGCTIVRTVLTDGRALDLRIEGTPPHLPRPAADNEVRFDAALAAVRLGRGSDLIGLHLVLGILRETLVLGMLTADRDTGSDHHRLPTAQDPRARTTLPLLEAPLGPATAREAYLQYGRWRQGLDPEYIPDPSGLDALIRRGTRGTGV